MNINAEPGLARSPLPPARSFLDFVLPWGAVAAFAVLAGAFWFICDDALISFRYARNWQAGLGPVFNPGESPPVEGYSNFLWMALLSLLMRFGVSPLTAAPAISTICGTILVFCAYFVMRRFAPPFSATFGALLLATNPSMVIWATGGLETMPFALLLFLTCERLWCGRSRGAAVAAGLCAAGVTLIRVEGIAWVLFALAVYFVSHERETRNWRARTLIALAPALAAFAAFLVWRHWIYGEWIANTAVAKGGLDLLRLKKGLYYIGTMWLTQLPLFLALPATIVALRRFDWRRIVPFVALVWAVPIYSVVVGGDFMAFGRFLVPMMAPAAILMAVLSHVAWNQAANTAQRAALGGVGIACLGLNIAPLWDLHVVPENLRAALHFRLNSSEFRSEIDQWRFQKKNAAEFATMGRVLSRVTDPGDSIVEAAIGAVGYYSDRFIYDQVGLVTPIVARRSIAPDERPRSPGHDKWVEPEWFVEHGIVPTVAATLLLNEPLDTSKARAAFAKRFQAWQQALRARTLANQYAADFVLFRTAGEASPRALFLWRKSGAISEKAVGERLRQFVQGGSTEILEGITDGL